MGLVTLSIAATQLGRRAVVLAPIGPLVSALAKSEAESLVSTESTAQSTQERTAKNTRMAPRA